MNDFFIVSSATFPNDSFAKIRTNRIFSTKIIKKNGQLMSLRNKGIDREKADGASTQRKIIFFRLLVFIY